MIKTPQLNSFLHRGENLSDGLTDVDLFASIKSAADIGIPQLLLDDTIDHVVNAADATNVEFSVSGLAAGASGTVTFTDAANHQVTAATDAADSTFTSDTSAIGAGASGADSFTTPATNSSGNSVSASLTADTVPVVTVANGATVEIDGASDQSVIFAGTTGTLKIDDSRAFAGHISGLTGSDALDLADVSYGANTTASFSGDANGGTLTVTDGTDTAHVALLGDYLTSGWTLSTDGHGGTVVVDPPLPGDGSANAPAGTPQLPNILSGYTERPSWMVAGVDYAVGIPQGTVLKDPATINMAGVTVDKNLHQIEVTASNITLDAYDFSLAGGWSVITQAANTTISNSNFKIGSNHNFTIYGDNGSSNLTVINCVIDGNMTSDSLNNGLIYTSTSGLTVEYTLLKNGFSDFIQAQGGGQVTLEYNVLNNNGNVNAHPDWLQTLGNATDPFTETIMYNTAYQTVGDGTQGWQLNDNGAILAGASQFAYNTIIALPGAQVSPIVSYVASAITGTVSLHDNFVDSRGGNFGNKSFHCRSRLFAERYVLQQY